MAMTSFLKDILNAEKAIFHFAGLYKKSHGQKKAPLILLSACFFIGFTWLLEISLIIFVVLSIKDLGTIISALMLLLQQTAFVVKLAVFGYKQNEILMMERTLETFAGHRFVIASQQRLQDNLKHISRVGHAYRTSCVVCCIVFTVKPFFNGIYQEYDVPLAGYIPFKITSGYRYAMVCLFQMVSFYIAGCLNSSLDVFCCKLMKIASSLIEVLDIRLTSVGRYDLQEDQEDYFRTCISFHNEILKFIKDIEGICNYIVFSQFAASSIVICTTAFQLVTLPVGSWEYIASLMYLTNMIVEVGLYCWYGHHIQTTTDYLSSACYQSQWYEADHKIRKMMIVFMERNKKAVTLTAAKMVPLSLTTLTAILRTSYSYFAVLKQVYQDNQ